jgi:hypothetical protein
MTVLLAHRDISGDAAARPARFGGRRIERGIVEI